MEGTFFGNVMSTASDGKVPAYFCEGPGFAKGIVPGRLGAYQPNAPYRNPWGDGAMCADHCSKHNSDGYTTCDVVSNPITVWRAASYNPVFEQQVRRVRQPVERAHPRRAQLVNLERRPADPWTPRRTNQQYLIVQVATSQWKIVNVNSGKAVINRNGAVAQNSYSGDTPTSGRSTTTTDISRSSTRRRPGAEVAELVDGRGRHHRLVLRRVEHRLGHPRRRIELM
jgi:hypothetical protein